MNKSEPKNKILNALLFFAIYFFVTFLSKKLIPHSTGGLAFVVMNLGTFLAAVVMTALTLAVFSRKIIIILVPVIVILALAIAMN